MRRARSMLLVALWLPVVCGGCSGARTVSPHDGGVGDARTALDHWPAWPAGPLAGQVDILVVLPEDGVTNRQYVLEFFADFARRILTPSVGKPLPDVQIGLVRSHVAVGAVCSHEPDDGGQRLIVPPYTLSLEQIPEGLSWPPADGILHFLGGAPAGIEDWFWGLWKNLFAGCDVNQYLETVDRALDGRNPGFPRPGALLVILVLSDHDDCSLRDATLWQPGTSSSRTGCYGDVPGLRQPIEYYAPRIVGRHDGPMLFAAFADCSEPIFENSPAGERVTCVERCSPLCVRPSPTLCRFPALFAAQSPQAAGLWLDSRCLRPSKLVVNALVEQVLLGAQR